MPRKLTLEEKHPELFLAESNVDRRTCKRVVPMEVLNLGFPRTGTASMQTALNILGIPCWHGLLLFSSVRDCDMWIEALDAKFAGKGERYKRADWDRLLGNYGAVADVPTVCFAEDLIEAYPEAKVVLVERDIERWYKSFDNALISAVYNPMIFWLSRVDKRYIGLLRRMTFRWINGWMKAYSKEEMRARARPTYREHYELVRRVTPKDRLLEYHLGSGWEPLCTFLGKPIPDVPFPKSNETDMLLEKVGIIIRRRLVVVLTKALMLVIPFLILVAAWRFSGIRPWITVWTRPDS